MDHPSLMTSSDKVPSFVLWTDEDPRTDFFGQSYVEEIKAIGVL
jgi:hypothetical protein